ncbi:MAG: methyltransferase domain-containing protein [Elainellaceae cyanobacterium]
MPTSDSSQSLSAADLTDRFWEGRYQEGTARWDLGQPAPVFVSLLNSPDAPQPGRMAVLGSGRGHDALLFAEHGFEVVGFDFAPSAIEAARTNAQQRGLSAEFLQRDIFGLDAEFAQQFDYVLEHTCYCAIAPEQRTDYVKLVRAILRPQGELIGLFWAHSRPGGPPFGTTPDAIRQRFAEFELIAATLVSNSVEGRKGEEYLMRFRKP